MAIDFMLKSWGELSQVAVVRAWKPLLGDGEKETAYVPQMVDDLQAATANLPGFEEVGREELMGLVAAEDSQETTLEELLAEEETEDPDEVAAEPVMADGRLSVNHLRQVLSMVANLVDEVGNLDRFDKDRVCQCIMTLNEAFSPYKKMYMDHVNTSQQRCISDFFRSRASAPPAEQSLDDSEIDAVINDVDNVSVSSLTFSGFGDEGEESDSSSSTL